MSASPERQPPCGFCDGSGLWIDADAGPPATDPCPLCDGTGLARVCEATAAGDAPGDADAVDLDRLVALLARLSQADRQRLYELLHRQYDCRIYR